MIDTDVIDGEVLTKARRKRGDVEMLESHRGGVEFRSKQVPIDYYLNKKLISKLEYIAADKLFRDFKQSGQMPSMVIDLDPIRGGIRNFTDRQMEAREQWRKAILAIEGTIAKLMVINVCCYGKWLNETAYLHYKTSHAAMARFHEALDDLIKFYDLTR